MYDQDIPYQPYREKFSKRHDGTNGCKYFHCRLKVEHGLKALDVYAVFSDPREVLTNYGELVDAARFFPGLDGKLVSKSLETRREGFFVEFGSYGRFELSGAMEGELTLEPATS